METHGPLFLGSNRATRKEEAEEEEEEEEEDGRKGCDGSPPAPEPSRLLRTNRVGGHFNE